MHGKDATDLTLEFFSKTPDLENFASAYRSSKRVIDVARQGGRYELDELDRRRLAT